MAKNITLAARCSDDLAERVQKWCELNNMVTTQLVLRAVDAYISTDHTLHAVSASEEDITKSLEKMKKKHRHTLDKLK